MPYPAAGSTELRPEPALRARFRRVRDPWSRYGAGAGAAAVVLYLVGGAIVGSPPDFDAPAPEAAAYFDEESDRIQLGSAFFAASAPFLVWFLATVTSLARDVGRGPRRAAAVAYGCGLATLILFLVDVSALAVGALRPENMIAAPELAAALLDVSFLAIAMAAFLTAGMFGAFAVVVLRDRALWPDWVGWLGVLAAVACALRIGTLFTTEGAFTAGGALGFWVPVIGFMGWTMVASVLLAVKIRGSEETAPTAPTGT
jgi:hypothetical protein